MHKMISELGKHIISIAAIEETRWKMEGIMDMFSIVGQGKRSMKP